MGKAVLHIMKPKGNFTAIAQHIEREKIPGNADPERTHLNRELIEFPPEVNKITQAIQHRINEAGIKRKISHNQIRAFEVMLSGSREDMVRIQEEGKLNTWCKDNVEWLQETFGKENVVSAVIHLDETSPHIHATVVPIVTGEPRKSRQRKPKEGKKTYKKKNPNRARLCADEVLTRESLKRFQDTYAKKMKVYGLERGIEGSKARHISTSQYYRELFAQNETLKESLVSLKEEQKEVYEKTRGLYEQKEEAQEKFLNMDAYVQKKKQDISNIESYVKKLKQDYEPLKTQQELNMIHRFFPMMKEQLRIAGLCEKIGLTLESIKGLLNGKTLTGDVFRFYSPEHNLHFEAKQLRLKIEKEPDNPKILRLNLNGENIMDWFKKKYQELKKTTHIQQPSPNAKKRSLRI